MVSSGASGKTHGVWFACFVQPLGQEVHPVGAVLDARDPERRGGGRTRRATIRLPMRVVDRAVRHHELRHHVDTAAEGLEVVLAPPRAGERLVPAVTQVEGDRDRRLGETGPDRVVELVAERAAAAVARGDRRGPDVHDARATRDAAIVELRQRRLGIGERDHRRGDDAILVREAPVLVEPAVERVQRGHRRRDVERAAPARCRTRASGT